MTDQPPEPAASPPAPAKPKRATTKPRRASANRLDAFLVVGSLLIVAGVLLGLFLDGDLDKSLPIISGVTGTLVGTVIGAYAGYRWGASASMRRDEPAA